MSCFVAIASRTWSAEETLEPGKDTCNWDWYLAGGRDAIFRHAAPTPLPVLRTAAIHSATLAGGVLLLPAPATHKSAWATPSQTILSVADPQLYSHRTPLLRSGEKPRPPAIPPIKRSPAIVGYIEHLTGDWKAELSPPSASRGHARAALTPVRATIAPTSELSPNRSPFYKRIDLM